MRGLGYFYSPHRLRLVRKVWGLVWVLLLSSTVVSAGQYWVHQQHSGMACHAESKSSDAQNHLEHCQLCPVHWAQLETPDSYLQAQIKAVWALRVQESSFLALCWYALHNLSTGPPASA